MTDDNNKFLGTFDTETEVLRKIEEMKMQGYSEDDMYVMSHDKDQISMVRGRTDIDYSTSEGGGWMDKFMSFLSGEDSTREAFRNMGLDQGETDRYYNEVQNGKILLYVDRHYGSNYGDTTLDRTEYSDNAAVASPGLTVDTNDQNSTVYNTDSHLVSNDERGSRSGADEVNLADRSMDTSTGSTYETDTAYGTNRNFTEDDERLNTGMTDNNSLDTGRTGLSDGVLETGTTGTTNTAGTGRGYDSAIGDDNLNDEERLRLHEERLNVDKEQVQTGEVNIGKHVVEEQQSIEVPVEREEVYVERRPVTDGTDSGILDGDGLTGRDADAYQEGDNIHIPIKEERVNVTKQDVVSEEIVVGKRKVQDTEVVNETVRREEADIDEDTNGLNATSDPLNRRDDTLDVTDTADRTDTTRNIRDRQNGL